MALCTIGYEKRSLEEYLHLLLDHGVEVVLDVRETAWSHKPGFSKTAFAQGLNGVGIEYFHLRIAGNPKWLREAAASHAECLQLYRSYVEGHPEVRKFAILTECGLVVRLELEHPEQHFFKPCSVCRYMKAITLENVYETLRDQPADRLVTVPEDVREGAARAMQRMIDLAS